MFCFETAHALQEAECQMHFWLVFSSRLAREPRQALPRWKGSELGCGPRKRVGKAPEKIWNIMYCRIDVCYHGHVVLEHGDLRGEQRKRA